MADALTIRGADSTRVALARVALRTALSVPGVRRPDSGRARTHFTAAGDGERLDGVTSLADEHGGYDVSLQLVCEPVPLLALSAQIIERVNRAAKIVGLANELADVHVRFSDLAVGEETK